MTRSGTVLSAETIYIATGAARQESSDVVYLPDGGNYAVVWQDNRSGGYDVFRQLVSPDGTLQASNTAIGAAAGKDDLGPRLAVDTGGRALVAWYRYNGGADGSDLYGRRLQADGSLAGPAFTLLQEIGNQSLPDLAAGGEDRVQLVWIDDRNGNADVYGGLYQPMQAASTAAPAAAFGRRRLQLQVTAKEGLGGAWVANLAPRPARSGRPRGSGRPRFQNAGS